jgi:hypothetical protein
LEVSVVTEIVSKNEKLEERVNVNDKSKTAAMCNDDMLDGK